VTLIRFRGTFELFWDLTEVSAQSWYKVRTFILLTRLSKSDYWSTTCVAAQQKQKQNYRQSKTKSQAVTVLIWREKLVLLPVLSNLTIPVPASYSFFVLHGARSVE